MKLEGRVVLVTGAGRGIGRALAHAFAGAGAKVALLGKTKKNLLEVQKELKDSGATTFVVAADVADEGAVSRAVAAVEQQLGPVDVLVNNAGIFAAAPVEKMDAVVFDRVLAVNLRGPFLMSRAVLPGMKSRKRGHIVNIASTAGRRGFPGGGAYCASKFGLAGLSEVLLYEARTLERARHVRLPVDREHRPHEEVRAPLRSRTRDPAGRRGARGRLLSSRPTIAP